MKVTDATDIFRKTALLPAGKPVVTLDGDWMEYYDSLDATFPCLYT